MGHALKKNDGPSIEFLLDQVAPILNISSNKYYKVALGIMDELVSRYDELPSPNRDSMISILAQAIETYENTLPEVESFNKAVSELPADVSMLRLLMDQHGLGVADLPEIGSKSMVSRVLSGERELSKKHIRALSERFGIDPGLFF